MNIYIHVESSSRELDSKLLLGILAASKGHHVMISNLSNFIRSMKLGLLEPGIFHTKSLTPADDKIFRHQKIIENNFQLTSLDEEGGLVDFNYEKFAVTRYSNRTIEQSSAVFGWGSKDVDTLKKIYPKHSSKIHKTGSPRADLWKSFFYSYWGVPKKLPQKPFILVSSNLGIFNNKKRISQLIEWFKKAGYYQRDPELMKRHLNWMVDEGKMMLHYIDAIKILAKNNNLFEIVLRPHPVEGSELWKVLLEDTPNVHVINEGPITPWVNSSFAVLHNGCTTSIEASISGKPVITFIPFEQVYNRGMANELGHLVKNENELLLKVNELFQESRSIDFKNKEQDVNLKLNEKVFIDDSELAVEKIINVWESLESEKLQKSNNIKKLKLFLYLINIRDKIKKKLLKLNNKNIENNQKFPPLNKKEIHNSFNKLVNIFNIKQKIKYEILSDHTIVIFRK